MVAPRMLNLLILLSAAICLAATIRGNPLPDARHLDEAVMSRDADNLAQTVLGKR
ncbi:MAG: hypothetical protein JO002_00185, partial [Burkholderiaceae bacterium]|nr:hypothetical protein [Burkholderiaceae bacterium]